MKYNRKIEKNNIKYMFNDKYLILFFYLFSIVFHFCIFYFISSIINTSTKYFIISQIQNTYLLTTLKVQQNRSKMWASCKNLVHSSF